MPAIRALVPADADALFSIEMAANAYPWSHRQFVDGLTANEFGWGIEMDFGLAGFALFNKVLDEASLLDIAVSPEWHRRGLARELLRFALNQLAVAQMARCLLEVRISNSSAIALYSALGFVEDGRRLNYYRIAGGREDAVLMSFAF